jgi:hypothetical protein
VYEKRLHINRAIGGYCYHCRIAGNPYAGNAKDQGNSTGNGLQIEFEERGIGRSNVP